MPQSDQSCQPQPHLSQITALNLHSTSPPAWAMLSTEHLVDQAWPPPSSSTFPWLHPTAQIMPPSGTHLQGSCSFVREGASSICILQEHPGTPCISEQAGPHLPARDQGRKHSPVSILPERMQAMHVGLLQKGQRNETTACAGRNVDFGVMWGRILNSTSFYWGFGQVGSVF